MQYVPVKSKDDEHLMPTHPNKAGMLIKKGLATPYWSNGIFCIRLNYAPDSRYKQNIVVGIDPGSKREGFTVKSEAHTYLNVQAKACDYVGKKLEKRKNSRRGRRHRKVRCRKNKTNRLAGKARLPAGTRARWAWKLRIFEWMCSLYPITHVCVEDIRASTRPRQRQWNASFSPLEVGKQWFYQELRQRAALHLLQGHDTKAIRERLGLKKSSNKVSETFAAHCVDSWCLAHHVLGGSTRVDNTSLFCIEPIPYQRRNLHRENFQKGGVRHRYGGTMCISWKKGTLVKHARYGLGYVSGYQGTSLSLTGLDGKRMTPATPPSRCKRLKRIQFRYKPIGAVPIQQHPVQLRLW